MMAPYILFVLLITARGYTLTTQELSSRVGCDHAAQTLVDVFHSKDVTDSVVWCVPKNGIGND